MPFDANIKSYLRAYQSEYNAAIRGGQHTAELSFRVPMHTLFTSIARDLNPGGNFDIILEPKNQGRMGRPDWRIQDAVSLGVYGYIEGKGPSADPFDIAPYQDQIHRFTHCEFSEADLRELLDLLNKIATQMQFVTQIDEILHSIVGGEVSLLDFSE